MKRINVSDAKLMLMKALFVCLPFLIVLIISYVNGFSLLDLRPVWSDEYFYHAQVKGVLAYGKPLGYWGYNGTHAVVGTFGAWGASVIYLLSLFAGLIPGNFNMLILSNLLWACFANCVFLVLTKPDKKTLLRLIIVYATLYVNHCYSLTAMAEILRYSLAVLLAGLTYFLLRKKEHLRYSVVLLAVTPCMIFVAMSAYIPFAAVLPIWCYVVYRRYPAFQKHKWVYVATCIAFTVVATIVVFVANEATASPYTVNWVGNVLACLREGFFTGLQLILSLFWTNFKESVLKYAFDSSMFNEWSGFLSYYMMAYLFAIIMAAWAAFRSRSNDSSRGEIPFISLYFLTAYLAAFVVMYGISCGHVMRGINVAFVYVLYLAAADRELYSVKMIKKIALFSLIGVIPFACTLNATFLSGRVRPVSEDEVFLRNQLAEFIQVREEGDPWENTVDYFDDSQYMKYILYFPDGVGVNYMHDNSANQNAKYCVLEKNFAGNDMVDVMLESGYHMLYEDDHIALIIHGDYV